MCLSGPVIFQSSNGYCLYGNIVSLKMLQFCNPHESIPFCLPNKQSFASKGMLYLTRYITIYQSERLPIDSILLELILFIDPNDSPLRQKALWYIYVFDVEVVA